MECWTVNSDHKPVKVNAEARGNGKWWIKELGVTIPGELLFSSLEDAAKSHLKFLKKELAKNEMKINQLKQGIAIPESPPSLEELARFESAQYNDKHYRKTKKSYIWVVK